MKANTSNLLQFLSNEKAKKIFIIPPFQRNYDWTDEQCKELFDDVESVSTSNREHYIGNIVFYKKDVGSESDPFKHYTLIDGQQRITTILLLICALRDLNSDNSPLCSELSKYLFNNSTDNNYRITLKQTSMDSKNFESVVENKITEKENNIVRNYYYFMSLLKDSKLSPTDIYAGLKKLIFVEIDLEIDFSKKDSLEFIQTIFEKINSTGKPLSAADLIRNYLLISNDSQYQDTLYKNYWVTIENKIKNEDNNISQFAKCYLILNILDDVKKDEVYKQFKKHFNENPKSHEEILKELVEYAEPFSWLLNNDKCPDEVIKIYLEELNAMRSNDAYPLYMYLLSKYNNSTKEELRKIFRLLSDFMIRYRIVSPSAGSSDLRNTMINLLKELVHNDIELTYTDILTYLSNITNEGGAFPTDEKFKEALKKSQKLNYTHGAVLLRKIEYFETKNTNIPLKDITVEHFFPQNPDETWKRDFGIKDIEAWRDLYLNCIGNLGIMSLGYNAQNSNKSWNKKLKQIKDVQYKITNEVAKYVVWNEDTIKERNINMSDRACNAIQGPEERTTRQIDADDGKYSANDESINVTNTNLIEVYYKDKALSISSWCNYFNKVCEITYKLNPSKFEQLVTFNKVHGKNNKKTNQLKPMISSDSKLLNRKIEIKDSKFFTEGTLNAEACRKYAKQVLDYFNITEDFEFLVESKKSKETED